MTVLIDFVIYAVLMFLSFAKAALMGAAIVLPFFLIWSMLATSADADRRARELYRNRR